MEAILTKVTGKNNQIAYMNINSTEKNTPAHEFGHHMGLADRYLDGLNWDLSNGIQERRTTPIGTDEIDDPDYDPNNNLYSSGDATLTEYQIRVVNGLEGPEPDYQKGRGFVYRQTGRNEEAVPYRVNNGRVNGLKRFKGKQRSTRNKLIGHILKEGLY